jgi:hypothetical protein
MPGVWMFSGSSSPDLHQLLDLATVTLPQVAIIGLKLREVLR